MRKTEFRLLAGAVVCAATLAWAPHASAQKVIALPGTSDLGSGLVLLEDDAKASEGEKKETVNNNEVWIGVMGAPMDESLRKHFDLEDGQGILVGDVMQGSPADKAGIKKNDILLSSGDT